MDVSKIKDEDSLRAWLKGRSREDAVAIALYSSMRMLPFYLKEMERKRARKKNITALPILRALISSGALRFSPPISEREAALSAAHSFVYLGGLPNLSVLSAASYSARAAASALKSDCEKNVVYAVQSAEEAVFNLREATEVDIDFWKNLLSDAEILDAGIDRFAKPLWDGAAPNLVVEAYARSRAIWVKNPKTWDFWVRWWDGVIAGQPLDWELQKQVALIPDGDWKKGPKHIAALIRNIEKKLVIDEANITKAPKPDTTLYLTQNRLVARMQAQGLAAQIVDVIERYARDTGCNDLPDAFQALRSMPVVLLELGRKLADATTTEDALRAEVQRLNAQVLRLEADLREAKTKTPTDTFSENFKKQAAKSLGDWKMWGALVGGVSVLGGVLAMVDAAQSIADSVQGIFGDQLPESGEPLPELQDKALPNLPELPRLTDV